MIVFALLVSLIHAILCIHQGDASKTNWFEAALEELKAVLKNGDSTLNIQALDPLDIDRTITWGDTSESFFSFNGSISGFSDYTVNSGDLESTLNTIVNLTFSQINVTGSYALNATYAGIFPLQGLGDITTSVQGLNASINATIEPDGGVIRLPNFAFSYDYENSTMELTGVLSQFDVGDTLSQILEDAVPNFLQKYNDLVGDVASLIIRTKGNSFLETLNINRIIEIVKRLTIDE